jgi:hypothetical protein
MRYCTYSFVLFVLLPLYYNDQAINQFGIFSGMIKDKHAYIIAK